MSRLHALRHPESHRELRENEGLPSETKTSTPIPVPEPTPLQQLSEEEINEMREELEELHKDHEIAELHYEFLEEVRKAFNSLKLLFKQPAINRSEKYEWISILDDLVTECDEWLNEAKDQENELHEEVRELEAELKKLTH